MQSHTEEVACECLESKMHKRICKARCTKGYPEQVARALAEQAAQWAARVPREKLARDTEKCEPEKFGFLSGGVVGTNLDFHYLKFGLRATLWGIFAVDVPKLRIFASV